jgi:hypothetical protein
MVELASWQRKQQSFDRFDESKSELSLRGLTSS